MFTASRPFLFFDYFRVPYRVVPGPGALIRPDDNEDAALHWALPDESVPFGEYRLDGIPIFCRLLPDMRPGDGWARSSSILDTAGNAIGSIWRDEHGGAFLPFDPEEVIRSFWSESYHATGGGSRLKKLATRSYYRVRPVLPRAVQIRMRRLFSRVQARSPFPRWPVETALHDFYDLLFKLTAELARKPVPYLAPWPAGHDWALVLTHDVETRDGYRLIDSLRSVETATGHRSSWNFVPKRYDVEDSLVRELEEEGFEVGVHGLYHDGRDLESLSTVQERAPEIRRYAERWHAKGFRSPATHRAWDLMPLLGFDYDSSYPDTDPFEPQSGGCCSWLPYFNRDLVELPITLPQDHTLFVILGHSDESLWLEKADLLRSRGGMALLITHPDYHLDGLLPQAYERFLESLKDDETVWHALPRDVSSWWRRRAESTLRPTRDGWEIDGARDASIRYAAYL